VDGGIRLTWNTETGKSYRLDATSNLMCWSVEGEFAGNGNPIQQTLNPFAIHTRRFYRVVEK